VKIFLSKPTAKNSIVINLLIKLIVFFFSHWMLSFTPLEKCLSQLRYSAVVSICYVTFTFIHSFTNSQKFLLKMFSFLILIVKNRSFMWGRRASTHMRMNYCFNIQWIQTKKKPRTNNRVLLIKNCIMKFRHFSMAYFSHSYCVLCCVVLYIILYSV
jgi:hypothetical protein